MFVDAADDLFGVPHRLDLAARIASGEQAQQLGPTLVVETLIGADQQDLGPPPADRAAEAPDLDRHAGGGEVGDDLVDPLLGHLGVVDVVDPPHGLPCHADLAMRIPSGQEADQALGAGLVEAFSGHRETPAGPVERVMLTAPLPQGVLLDPAAALIESLVGEADDVERIRDLDGRREHPVAVALNLLSWTRNLTLTGPLRRATPKTLGYRLLHIAGKTTTAGRKLHLDQDWPWTTTLLAALDRIPPTVTATT